MNSEWSCDSHVSHYNIINRLEGSIVLKNSSIILLRLLQVMIFMTIMIFMTLPSLG